MEFTVTERARARAEGPGGVVGDALLAGASVTWRDGRLTGDGGLIAAVEGVVQSGVPVSLPGLFYGRPDLAEHGAALATVLAAFDSPASVTGDAPEWDPLPPGAIAGAA